MTAVCAEALLLAVLAAAVWWLQRELKRQERQRRFAEAEAAVRGTEMRLAPTSVERMTMDLLRTGRDLSHCRQELTAERAMHEATRQEYGNYRGALSLWAGQSGGFAEGTDVGSCGAPMHRVVRAMGGMDAALDDALHQQLAELAADAEKKSTRSRGGRLYPVEEQNGWRAQVSENEEEEEGSHTDRACGGGTSGKIG